MIFAKKRSVKPILQFAATECGVASLAMLFAYFGLYVSMEELREECGAARDGTSLAKLIEVAEAHGMIADAYKVELSDIAQLNIPVIAYWRFQHYVVITHVSPHKIYLNDPAQGAISVSYQDFDKYFTGIIIHLTPGANFKKVKSPAVLLPIVVQWVARYTGAFAFMIICLLLGILIPVVNNRLNAIFIDKCVLGGSFGWLMYLLPITSVILVMFIIITILQKTTQFRLIVTASMEQMVKMMRHVMQLPMLFFALRQKPELTALMMRAELVTHALYQGLANGFVSMMLMMLVLISLFVINVDLTAVLLLQMLLLLIPVKLLVNRNREYEQANVEQLSQYYSLAISTMSSLETIKLNGLEASVIKKWVNALYNKLTATDQSNRIILLLDRSAQAFNGLSMLITLSIGSLKVTHGSMTLGSLFGFYGLQLYLTTQVWTVLNLARDMQNAVASVARIQDLLRYPADKRFEHSPDHGKDCTLIVCHNMSFAYSQFAAPVLSNINMSIACGQHVALVGATGSGKSTLAKLFAQLFHPTAGELSTVDVKKIAYVSQNVNLFSGTIYDNLTLWRQNIPQSHVLAALEDAGLKAMIAARGLHGKVEEGGRNFSGGERQRLDIARALIQSPALLILDEATSALDSDTEAYILSRLRARSITIIFVAHRLSSVKHCDQIWVMQNGKIIEYGNHQELIAHKSSYHMLIHHEEMHDAKI